MMTMNEVVDGWKRQYAGSNQIGTEERNRVDIYKQAANLKSMRSGDHTASGGLGIDV